MSLGRTLYRTATRAAHPLLGLLVSHRVRRGKEDGERVAERFAKTPAAASSDSPLIWLHGASIGETRLLVALAERLAATRPDVTFLLTSQTTTSANLIAKAASESSALKDRLTHQYAPIDAPGIAARFIKRWAPSVAVFAEGEIWPNLLLETKRAGIPAALINARMTSGSVNGWRNWPGFARDVFSTFNVILAADDQTAKALSDLSGQHHLEVL